MISILCGHLLRLPHLYRMSLRLHFNLVLQLARLILLCITIALFDRAFYLIKLLPPVHVLIENCVKF